MNKKTFTLGSVLLVGLCLPGTAAAYLDPTTGSIAFQTITGGFLVAASLVRVYWRRIRSLFGSHTTERSAGS